ncbi:MAG: YkgJ family cysteine cluster protein [Infirmifilum sp.]
MFESPYCLKCGKCCINTEMILLEEDVQRLKSLGLNLDAVAERRGGFLRLKNVDGRCVFYDEANGHCRIYEHRPLGCRLYPLVFDEDRGVVLDEDCPLAREFAQRREELAKGILELERLLKGLERMYGYRVDWKKFRSSSALLLKL